MAAQRRIRPADEHETALIRAIDGHDGLHRVNHNLPRLFPRIRPRIGQYIKKWTGILKCPAQGLGIPAGQRQTTVYRLNAGGIVIKNNDLSLHGQFIPHRPFAPRRNLDKEWRKLISHVPAFYGANCNTKRSTDSGCRASCHSSRVSFCRKRRS